MWWCVVVLFALYVYNRLSCGRTRSSICLVGKTALITGANSGIGYQTALNLASRGCKVIMADIANMEESKRNIIKDTNNSNITTKFIDLSSLKSVRDFASDISKTEERLDILINNAGVFLQEENKTSDEYYSVNYLGHFLLTHLLIDLLKKSAPSRIVFTSSIAVFLQNLTVENLNCTQKIGKSQVGRIYSNTKFALLIASDIFAEKLKGTGVTSNAVHPGVVITPMLQKSRSSLSNIFFRSVFLLWVLIVGKDAWEGSQDLVHVAVSKELEYVTGKFFADCKPLVKPRAANDTEFCMRVWQGTETIVQLRPEEKL